jgi:hypothetical protein
MMSTLNSEMSPEMEMRERHNFHPVAKLIKNRFGPWYNGPLTVYELDVIKEKMEKAEKQLRDYEKEVRGERHDYIRKIRQQQEMCGDECVRELEEHLKVCKGINGKYKCTKDFVFHDCQFNSENGRCSHYYEIEELETELGLCDESIYDFKRKYIFLEREYQKQLAIKENRSEEYEMFDEF